MKYAIILSLLLISNILAAQNDCPECEKFKIVGVYDYGPPPGGNWVILLLTVTEDLASSFDPHYSSLFFVDNQEDTITIPLGPSYSLPIYTTDTIPYLLELDSELSNQDFPTDFVGKLFIRTPTGGPCPNVTWCKIDYSKITTSINENHKDQVSALIYPNPADQVVTIETKERIRQLNIYNQQGRLLSSFRNIENGNAIDLRHMEGNLLIFQFRYVGDRMETQQVLKMH